MDSCLWNRHVHDTHRPRLFFFICVFLLSYLKIYLLCYIYFLFEIDEFIQENILFFHFCVCFFFLQSKTPYMDSCQSGQHLRIILKKCTYFKTLCWKKNLIWHTCNTQNLYVGQHKLFNFPVWIYKYFLCFFILYRLSCNLSSYSWCCVGFTIRVLYATSIFQGIVCKF